MEIKNKKIDIKDILLSENYISSEDMAKAEEFAIKNHSSIVDYLFSEGLINKDIIGQAMAEALKVPYANLNLKKPSKEQILRLPEAVAKKYNAVIFTEDSKMMVVTTDDPLNDALRKELEKIFSEKKIVIAFSLKDDINDSLASYRKTLETRFMSIIEKRGGAAPQVIDEIIEDALFFNSSDIHLEPQDKEVLIRFRVDGVLQEAGRIPKEYYENILNRIKVQSDSRIDEHFSAQDGSIRYIGKNEVVADIRVSIVPTLNGEKVVMRLLSSYVKSFSMNDLGLSEKDQEALVKSGKKPFGMILVAGPTGSGKTTTLYALLKLLNRPEVNITTIEDPVEYRMPNINQIQVNQQTNLTFAKGLRSIVRQDPDIILVGEIRDEETAEIAVNAALTGHLLLSTFHANDAPTAIPRLLDMGVESFLLASTLELIIAQRLVRKICEQCRYSYSESIYEIEKNFPEAQKFFSEQNSTLYKGKGCNSCNQTGYKGRTSIFEFIYFNKDLQDLILKNPSSQEIWEVARKNGSKTLFEDGLEKVKNGITTLEELMRVASPPKNYVQKKNKSKTEN